MKVLIICNDFPPNNSVGAHRPHSWFRYFGKYGVEVSVVTKNQQSSGHFPGTEMEVLPEGIIYRVPTKNILPERMLKRYGMERLAAIRKAFTLIYRLLAFVHPFFDRHYYLFLAASELVQKEKFDFVIITGEPFILFRYGHLLKIKFNVRWIADYRDGWSLNPIFRLRTDIFNRCMQWWERKQELKIVANCHFITTVDPFYVKRLSQFHHKPCEVIYNGFDEFSEPPVPLAKNIDLRLTLTHSGTLTPLQNIEFLLQAIKELDEEKLIAPNDLLLMFVGLQFFPGQVMRVLSFSENVNQYIRISPRVSKEEILFINHNSDFLVSVTEENFPAYYTKTYDYFAVKKPILVTPGDEELSALVKKLNAGYSFYTVSDLKIFIAEKIKLKKKGLPVSDLKLNISEASFFKRENQAIIFTKLLQQYALPPK